MVCCEAVGLVKRGLFWRRSVARGVDKAEFLPAAKREGEERWQRERAGVAVGRASEGQHKLPVRAKDLGGMQGRQ